MQMVREKAEEASGDATRGAIGTPEDRDAVTVDERDRISRLARAVGLRIDVSMIRDRAQALRVIQTLALFRSRMR